MTIAVRYYTCYVVPLVRFSERSKLFAPRFRIFLITCRKNHKQKHTYTYDGQTLAITNQDETEMEIHFLSDRRNKT